jgi:ribosomal protein S18 acetylase RimI-like enzyme
MVRYPTAFRCSDGRVVAVRPVTPEDLDRLMAFFEQLPTDDRMHLRVDVTQRDLVRQRLSPPPHWNVLRLVALQGERIVAEASVEHRTYGFEAHVGEMRLIVATDFRRTGLAHYLGRRIFAHGIAENLERIEAHVMEDRPAVVHCFEKLGFERIGSLRGFVKDIEGVDHDLLILALRT